MRNTPELIVVIITIVILMIVIGFVIANLVHKYAVDTAKEIALQDMLADTTDSDNEFFQPYEEFFALQILASSNYSKVEHLQNKLQKANYESEITKVKRDGEILYRLRLKELYRENDAIKLGEELKKDYPSISSYWLEERKTELAVLNEQTIEPQEKKTSNNKEYEIQFMATSDYAKVISIYDALQKKGYEPKILTLKKGSVDFYRLRLKGRYSKNKANALGNEIKKTTPLITSFWLDEETTSDNVPIPPKATVSKSPQSSGEYEIQILANSDKNFVQQKEQELERGGYTAKVTSTLVKGNRFYRLRLQNSYSKTKAEEVGKELKKKFGFITSYWVTKADLTATIVKQKSTSKKTVKAKPKPEEKPAPVKHIPKDSYKTMICLDDYVDIRIGPGSYYALDDIGKLMKGIKIYVVDEKNGWIEFTITQNDKSWSGWVDRKSLKYK